MAPPPNPLTFQPGYHDHTYSAFSEPLNFQGWNIERVRNAIFLHRQGIFLESAILAQMVIAFPPVYAALFQRVAPALSLPRRVRGGTTGLSGFLRSQLEESLVPSDGLTPSPYFPPDLYGAIGIDLALPGFSILQHVMGDPDPDTGERDLYTRRWPTYATTYYTNRRTFVATTDSTPCDIANDGHWTLIADCDTPHLYGALLAIGEEALDGKQTARARASWINAYGNPKLAVYMPPQVSIRGEEGMAFFRAASLIRNPDGFGVFPNASKLEWTALASTNSTAFADALASNLMMVAIALVGTDGTVESGSGGVYTSPTFQGVARRHVQRDLAALLRGANLGHVKTWVAFNYSASIREAREAGESVVMPALDIPLPDPDADARIDSVVKRTAALTAEVVAEKGAGFVVDQSRVDSLAVAYGVTSPTISDAEEVKADLATETDSAANDPATPLPVDDSAEKLAAKMTAGGVKRCEHACTNRCRICGIERVRDFDMGPDGEPVWKVEWRAIPKPGQATPVEKPVPEHVDPVPPAPEETEPSQDAGAAPAEGAPT